ncbi:hypothetical protein B2J88_17825 [Rhodococcus sp. SRB_17]|nr:hypothetical protein [Rhodococcus sp. SRB_17]
MKVDLAESSALSHLQQLSTALSNLSSQPGQAEYQRQVSTSLHALESALTNAQVNTFSPTWRQVLDETAMSELLGVSLLARVQAAIAENQLTPTVASSAVQQLFAELQALSTHVDQLLAALRHLQVGQEDLEPGECEIGVLVPRNFVSNRLDKFADELEELNRIFGTFSELATGERPSFAIRTISSSDLSIFLESVPAVGAAVAVAVERIVALYRQLLEIRKLQGELFKQGLDKKDVKGVEDHANKIMDKGIDVLVKDLLTEFEKKGDGHRTNELAVEIKYSLKKIANRIDRGFNIEVRMEEPEAPDEEVAVDEKAQQMHERIQGAATGMQFLKLEGDPILSLAEADKGKAKKADSAEPATA